MSAGSARGAGALHWARRPSLCGDSARGGALGVRVGRCETDRSLLGRMFIFYGNKTSTQFLSFTPTLICSDDLQANILGSAAPWP